MRIELRTSFVGSELRETIDGQSNNLTSQNTDSGGGTRAS